MREQTEDEMIEIEELEDEEILDDARVPVTRGRRTLTIALGSIVVLAIIAFTYLLVTTLMQHPRVYDDGTLFVPGMPAERAISLVSARMLRM